jgi:hypothetical protein
VTDSQHLRCKCEEKSLWEGGETRHHSAVIARLDRAIQ